MRVVLALDKFKGTFDARQACKQLADGIRHRNPKIEITLRPMADGGEGSAAILAACLGMEAMRVEVPDLLGNPTDAHVFWQHSRRIALVESASVLGVHRALAFEDALMRSNTVGVGSLLSRAFDLRPQEVWIGVGGTMTADAGWGLASLFGLRATDASGAVLSPCLANMDKIAQISFTEQPDYLKKTRIVALCDVNAPVKGGDVSLASFLEQKGATSSSVPTIEKKITTFWALLKAQKPSLPRLEDAFMGAGGGICLGLTSVFPQVRCELGATKIARATALGSCFQGATLAVCGEGCLDEQTLYGKAPSVVSQIAQEHQTPLLGVFGRCDGAASHMAERLNLAGTHFLFPPESHHATSDLVRLSKQRFHEIGIEIAHQVEQMTRKKT